MTGAETTAMPTELSPGERRVREKKRRRWAILGGLALAGLIPGFLLGYSQADTPDGIPMIWPAWIVILLSVSYVLTVTIGGRMLCPQMDEHELLGKYKAAAFAGGIFILVYPIWLLLWMGALVPEPSHWVLFGGFYVCLLGGDLYYRFRGDLR